VFKIIYLVIQGHAWLSKSIQLSKEESFSVLELQMWDKIFS